MSIRYWSRSGLKRNAVTVGWWMLGVIVGVAGFTALDPLFKAALTAMALLCAGIIFVPPKAVSQFMAELRGTTYVEPVSTEHTRVSDRSYPLMIKLPVATAAGASLWVVAQGFILTWHARPWIVIMNIVLLLAATLGYRFYSDMSSDTERRTARKPHRIRLTSVTMSQRHPNTIEDMTARAMTASLKEYAERQDAEAAERRDRARLNSAFADEKGEPV